MATCGLSSLPIGDGEPVVGFIIRKDMDELTPSYPWENYEPASFMLRGDYNDGGSITINDAGLALLRRTQEEASLIMRRVPYPEGPRIAMQRTTPFVAEYNPSSLKYGRPSLARQKPPEDADPNAEFVFSLWLAHAGVYDQLMDQLTIDRYPHGPAPLRQWLDAEVAKRDDPSVPARERDFRWREHEAGGPAMQYIQSSMMYLEPDQETEKTFLIERWRELKGLYKMMQELRLQLWPTAAWGSQDWGLGNHALLAQLRLNHIADHKRQWEEENGEEYVD